MLRTLVVLLAGAPALAADPPTALIEEIAELRKQIGDSGEVVSDTEDFVEALTDLASHHEAEAEEAFRPPPREAWERPAPERRDEFPGHRLPRAIRPPAPPQPTPRVQPPKILLRESAFELEGIAHRLEMAELFDESDAVREAAECLRESGRHGQRRDAPEPGEARRALERTRERLERDRRESEGVRRRLDQERRRLEEFRRRLERTERESAPRKRKPRPPEADDRLPPRGVHGGPAANTPPSDPE